MNLPDLPKNNARSTRLAVFPGQGSQALGMATGWLGSAAARMVLEEAEEALGLRLGLLMAEGAEAAMLTQTQNAQPALLLVGLMAVAALQEATGKPLEHFVGAVAGHSLGEYTAVAAGGGLSLSQAVKLVQVRAEAMAQAPAGGMSAVLGLEVAKIEAILQSYPKVGLANDNCAGQAVIAAAIDDLAAAEEAVKAAGAKRVLRLSVGGAFHTPLQGAAAAAVVAWLAGHEMQDLNLPCWMNYTAQDHVKNKEIKENLVKQITHRVRWREAMMNAAAGGVTQVVELGCGKVLAGLVPRCDTRLQAVSLSNLEDMLRWLEENA